jgi:oligoribonuclease NrnB/cAMP/cGMP phosphodiesterase (DHH superfamily)
MESYIYFNEEQYDFKLPSDIMPFIKQRKSEMESLVYKTAESGIYSKKILGHTVAVTVLNTTDLSIICSKILELKPEYDYIINFNFDLMQAQLRTLKDDIDLAEIASRYGGGGHKKASGFPINKSHINNLLNNILGITTNKHEEWHK